ncbi:MAG: hypothetical protein RJB39_44 [Candidatus Parcubacteria bacterium]|jgi:hypothetical protein
MDKQIDANSNTIVIKRQIQIEAISKAIYLVTDLFDLDEPLRLGLRKTSVAAVASFDKGHTAESLQKLHSMVRIAKDIQLISEMNARLLMNAIEGLRPTLNDQPAVDITHVLDIGTGVGDGVHEEKDEAVSSHTSHSLPQISQVYRPTPQSVSAQSVSDNSPAVTPAVRDMPKDRNFTQPAGMDIGSRRKKILEIVRAKGQVTINEFIDSIQGCSSKTIQRELTSLVLSGTLKKSGERRWSKYSLK